ncbi:MAG: DUF2892 domain-containing protein [Bacteroidetes bacterium]|nr:MAG: DUF2892 domain-containing protein [Bacteroidota bacterium]
MKTNVGSVERAIRIVLGLFIISLAFWGPESPWAFLGVVPVLTGLVRYCPVWQLIGVNTDKKIETTKI